MAKKARKSSGRKYSRKAEKKVGDVMREKKRGTLRSSSGRKVTSRKQAIAIGLSEARREGAKVPAKKTSRKRAASKTARKK
jgi:hypothetical protein